MKDAKRPHAYDHVWRGKKAQLENLPWLPDHKLKVKKLPWLGGGKLKKMGGR